ncbi:MAG: transglutaminase-like domain-containing protein [Sandaracinaceae bacterium]
MLRRPRILTLALVALSAVVLTEGARADGPTLHEFVPDVAEDEGSLLVSSGGAQPDAIVYQGEVLPAPEGGGLGRDERAMRAGPGDSRQEEEVGRRSPNFHPDRVTDLEGNVGYFTVFTPTIAPYKRVTSLDAVRLAPDGTPILAVADSRRIPVPVLGASVAAPDDRPRDRFWGSVVADFREGTSVPLPSVAPESRVLTLQTEPPTDIRLERDPAGNFHAVSQRGVRAQVRLVFLMDAPRTYFGQPLGGGQADAHAGRLSPVPVAVQSDALAFAAELGLARGGTFEEAMNTLSAYFRGFEESSDYPRDSGNIYLDLVRSRRGICRHRAYGFVITAQALGMHARFVHNEAHAWVEVERPAGGWMRVDLGGAATGLEARGSDDRPRYDPPVIDPLPRPAEYEQAYEEARRMSGLRTPPIEAAGMSGGPDGAGNGTGSGTGSRPATDNGGASGRGFLMLHLDRERYEVFRGHELEITGSTRGNDEGVEGLRVEAVLQAQRGDREWLLGVTVSREAGRFRGVFGVPPDLPVGDYRLVVRSPGNETWGPAVAR